MKPSKMKEIHEEKWNPTSRGSWDDVNLSFFKRKDLTVHRVYKMEDSTYYFVFSFDTVGVNRGTSYYRVGRFHSTTGKISVLGHGTVASKFPKKDGVPLPDDIVESKQIIRDNGYNPWLKGTKVYG